MPRQPGHIIATAYEKLVCRPCVGTVLLAKTCVLLSQLVAIPVFQLTHEQRLSKDCELFFLQWRDN